VKYVQQNQQATKLATCLLAGFSEPISLTLKMEAICSSETSVVTQRTTRRHIPEDDTLYNHRCENIKSYTVVRSVIQVGFDHATISSQAVRID
jgi:hypothetical protein